MDNSGRLDTRIAISDDTLAPTYGHPLAAERRMLRRLAFPDALIDAALAAALANRTTIERELLAAGGVTPEQYYAVLADYLCLPFMPELPAASVIDRPHLDKLLLDPRGLRLEENDGMTTFAIVPRANDLASLHRRLALHPELRRRVVVTLPSAVRSTVWEVGSRRRLTNTIHRLFSWQPRFSARIVFWGKQGFLIGSAAVALLAGLAIATGPTLLVVHMLMSLFYLLAILIRLAALRSRPLPVTALPDMNSQRLPVYTVMIALYREANMIGQLTDNLRKLNWPASKLDIKLVCEADDGDTIAAIIAARLPPHFELVTVPPAHPRTKPKALTYALSGARGQFLTIYDAEDRPHPDQLMEAWRTFEAGPPELACLQAPLTITNGTQSWITALFACEYAGLFRGILPFLARHRFPMPLGGTSNHFRTDALMKSRGWDPYNVAEDADLGLRLHRLGYHCGVIVAPTGEDAPTTIRSWTAQRSRWIKGWLQTVLVALREPGRLRDELGVVGFAVFLLNGLGMIVSALLHPLLFLALAITIATVMMPDYNPGLVHQLLCGVDLANILISYWAFLKLGMSRMTATEVGQLRTDAFYVPFYWLMLSYSAWKAFLELYRTPFLWRKTAHRPSST
ncbi:glycosyltransferase family 2 protein [Martelella endophytica]|uniref:glycosyltransferase family 2 protein n=1 Tax=Martelella endophytica TaxID=1486262 RepID=UPI000698246A|nr:glycosyltransferase family 2 protein [Martelella endophytica]